MPEATVLLGSGKVRELYALDGERLLLVTSDRISTFDVVLPAEIPDKGRVLAGLSAFWFARTDELVPNHLLALRDDGRSLECRRLEMLPIECVVRGYLAGSGWGDYESTGAVCGHVLPPGLHESERLPGAIVTPATKAADRTRREHRRSDRCRARRAPTCTPRSRPLSIMLYRFAAGHAESQGILLADTKFEFGLDADGSLVLVDEVLTPDSSRLWPADGYAPGGPPPSFDKQFVRDYCERVGWDKTAPGPELAGRDRRGHAGPLCRGVRATHGDRVRGVPRRPAGGPAVKATVLVRPKAGILDPQGEAVRASLQSLGFAVGGARVGRLVELELDARTSEEARVEVERMCEQLLANPLIESFEIELDGA